MSRPPALGWIYGSNSNANIVARTSKWTPSDWLMDDRMSVGATFMRDDHYRLFMTKLNHANEDRPFVCVKATANLPEGIGMVFVFPNPRHLANRGDILDFRKACRESIPACVQERAMSFILPIDFIDDLGRGDSSNSNASEFMGLRHSEVAFMHGSSDWDIQAAPELISGYRLESAKRHYPKCYLTPPLAANPRLVRAGRKPFIEGSIHDDGSFAALRKIPRMFSHDDLKDVVRKILDAVLASCRTIPMEFHFHEHQNLLAGGRSPDFRWYFIDCFHGDNVSVPKRIVMDYNGRRRGASRRDDANADYLLNSIPLFLDRIADGMGMGDRIDEKIRNACHKMRKGMHNDIMEIINPSLIPGRRNFTGLDMVKSEFGTMRWDLDNSVGLALECVDSQMTELSRSVLFDICWCRRKGEYGRLGEKHVEMVQFVIDVMRFLSEKDFYMHVAYHVKGTTRAVHGSETQRSAAYSRIRRYSDTDYPLVKAIIMKVDFSNDPFVAKILEFEPDSISIMLKSPIFVKGFSNNLLSRLAPDADYSAGVWFLNELGANSLNPTILPIYGLKISMKTNVHGQYVMNYHKRPISLDADGTVTISGHPNTLSGEICLGDIRWDSGAVSRIVNGLTYPNMDSAYHQSLFAHSLGLSIRTGRGDSSYVRRVLSRVSNAH